MFPSSRPSPILFCLLLTLISLATNIRAHLGSCEDHSPECSKWESWGFCDTNLKFMAQNCPVTCNVCLDPGCFNRIPFCDSWELEGFCSRYADVRRLCPHSCDLCQIPDEFLSNNTRSIARPEFDCGRPVKESGPSLERTKRQGVAGTVFGLDVAHSRSRRHDTGHPHVHVHQHDGEHDHVHEHAHAHVHDHQHEHPHVQADADSVHAHDPPSAPINFGKDHCSPVLIHERFLLIAAHCVLDPESPVRKIRLGSLNPVDYEVLRVIVHPNYKLNSHERYNDVALLETKETVQFGEEIFPSCLSDERPPVGSVVTDEASVPEKVNSTAAAGEGNDRLEIVQSVKCENLYKDQEMLDSLRTEYPRFVQQTDMFCADFQGNSTCEKHTRGPLFQDVSERRFLVGFVSKDVLCNQPNATRLPGFYTSVADHIDFINNIIYP
ncbi:uncharacterized protein LOC135206652 [Macrobrachium nipponense]|uniref:uncharacterized protein LOC135206652 n=1 Tax=Macrobrachium nipponense TaxID=159736 RepID=UPI0030C8C668